MRVIKDHREVGIVLHLTGWEIGQKKKKGQNKESSDFGVSLSQAHLKQNQGTFRVMCVKCQIRKLTEEVITLERGRGDEPLPEPYFRGLFFCQGLVQMGRGSIYKWLL